MDEVIGKKKPRVREWVYLALSILVTAFIILHSAIGADESAKWSGALTRFLTTLFNGSPTQSIVEVKGVDISYPTDYKYNSLEGYSNIELPIGITKRIDAVISPSNASNTAISYTISDSSIASIKQDKNYLYVEGKKEGSVEIKVTSLANTTHTACYTFEVIGLKAPVTYTVSDLEVFEESSFILPITYQNTNCYDVNKLDIINPHKDIVDISETNPKMYYASSVGSSTLSIGDRSFTITVKNKSTRVLPEFKGIFGDEVVYSGASTKYEVEFDNVPTSKEVTWSTSDSNIGVISEDGTLTLKDVNEDKELTIKAVSILDDKLFATKKVIVKKEVVDVVSLVIPNTETDLANDVYMLEVGGEVTSRIMNKEGIVYKSSFTVTSNNESVARAYIQGSYLHITSLREGNARIIVTSVNNPNVHCFIDVQVAASGVINPDNYQSFYNLVRKSLGHFLLFLIDGIFIFLYFYELDKHITFNNKRKWHYIVASALVGLLLAMISELIQHFIPSRIGSFMDVGIDFLGYAIGMGITLLITYLINRHKNKKKEV